MGIGIVWSGSALWVAADLLQPNRVLGTVAAPVAWYLRNTNSSGAPDVPFNYGDPGDKVLGCDWNGDGRATPGIFRNGT